MKHIQHEVEKPKNKVFNYVKFSFCIIDKGGARYVLAIGNDFIAKFYQLSINGQEIFIRQLGLPVSFFY